tara:strand:+ start:3960 stop:4328 length:369 start_codon:yes stop_codon:yes gene_type:complete
MSKVEKVKQFNVMMETFLGQISPLVGTSYRHYFEKLVKANCIMPIKQFYIYVSPFKNKIITKDESYFTESQNFKEQITGDSIFQEIIRLTNIYEKLDNDNRNQMWMYFQALFVLSEEYNKLS